MYQLTENIASDIAPQISYALRVLCVIFDKSISSRSPILEGVERAGTANSCYDAQNEQENTQNNVIKGDTRREMTVDTDQKYQEKLKQLPIFSVN